MPAGAYLTRTLCPVLVSRERELRRLEDELHASARGEGRMLLLSGPAGIGKTRLARELSERATAAGMTSLSGGCSDAELALPYLPFLEALGKYIDSADLDALRKGLGGAAADLASLFPRLDPAPPRAGDVGQDKLRFYESIVQLLELIAAEPGLLLVLDDLHHADPSTRDLLDYLARRLLAARVLLLGTYRTEEVHRKHPLLADIQRWRRSGLADVFTLDRLDADAIGRMVAAILDEQAQAGAGRALFERCEGNPFVLEELLKEAVDRGDLYRTDAGWEHASLSRLRLPATVRETVLLRVDRLEPEHLGILGMAAVLGGTFEEETLVSLAAEDRRRIREGLRVCLEQQLLDEDPRRPGAYHFRHALTREAVYEDLMAAERRDLHRRAAAVLRRQPDARAVEIAHHLFAAGDEKEAVPFCLDAARQAEKTWALLDAVDLYEKALPHIIDPVTRADVLHGIGRCLMHADRPGAVSAAERNLQEAVALFEGAGENVAAARVRVTLALAEYPRLKHAEAERELERAVATLEPLGPSAELADAYNHLAFFRVAQLDGAGSKLWAERALAAAEAVDAPLARVRAENLIGFGVAAEGDIDGGIAWLDRSAAEALEAGWTWHAVAAMNNALHFFPLERWGELPSRVDRMKGLEPEDFVAIACSWAWLPRGFPAKAAELAERARRAATSRESTVSAFWADCTLVRAYASMGRLEEAARRLPPADTSLHKQDQMLRWGAELHLAVVAGDERRWSTAAGRLRELVPIWPWTLESVFALQDLIDGARPDDAEAVIHSMSDSAFARALKLDLDCARGDFGAVATSAPEAIAFAERVDAPLFAGRARVALAEARAGSGDLPAAEALLAAAMQSAREREHWWQAEQVRRLAQKLGIQLAEPAPVAAEEDATATGERFVSVLFADVRDYTRLTRTLPPAVLADKIAAFHRAATQEIARHRGAVDKFAGDAVMASFNLAGASVDHAADALQAALALRDRTRHLGLAVGMAIATGPAVVGRLTGGANLSVLGETTNLAARLQAQAGAGQILLAEDAWRRLREPAPAKRELLKLKGFDRRVVAYRIS